MARQDIIVEKEDYREFIKWAQWMNPALADAIENTKDVIIDAVTNKVKYRIKKKDLKKKDVLDLYYRFLDGGQTSTTDDECIYFGHLAAVWRPIAEGLLI